MEAQETIPLKTLINSTEYGEKMLRNFHLS